MCRTKTFVSKNVLFQVLARPICVLKLILAKRQLESRVEPITIGTPAWHRSGALLETRFVNDAVTKMTAATNNSRESKRRKSKSLS